MSRTESGADMLKVSPFLIKKKIDGAAGAVMECKKLRNGSLLIKCFNKIQAEKVMKLTCLTEHIAVKVEIHNGFNRCKGKIFSRDLKFLTTEEILGELYNQKVTDILRIKRRDKETGKLTDEDLGLYILSFSTCVLPEKIFIGYESINVDIHVPLPFRCFKCFQFGHSFENCKKEIKCCPNCNKNEHTKKLDQGYEKCTRNPQCANCLKDHNSFSKTCEIYKQEFEIQRIKVTEKISHSEARRRYKSQHPLPTTFSGLLTSKFDPQPSTSKAVTTSTKNPLENLNTKTITDKNGNPVTLLPRNTSKYKLDQINKGNKTKKFKNNANTSESSNNMSLDESSE